MLDVAPTDYLIHKLGKTRRDFAKENGLGENHLLRLAQGRMTALSDVMIATFEQHFELDDLMSLLADAYNTVGLGRAYDEWRLEQTKKAVLPDFIPYVAGLSPAQRFAQAVGSMSKLAQTLKVNDYVVRRWVNGETTKLPEEMRASMKLAGYQHADEIDRAQQAWLEEQK